MKSHNPGQALIAAIESAAHAKGYSLDSHQQAATQGLGKLAQELLRPPLLARLGLVAPRSLYLWGPVGRGKSFLLDTFFAAIDLEQKRRVHFHAFFRELHQLMFEHRGQSDAMGTALDTLLGQCRLLCFDEFHLHDIGDAMLISRLFKALFKRHCVLVVTSNYPPEGLLPNPLYHERFLPTIKLIEQHMDIQAVAGEVDYRTSDQASADAFNEGAYICPGNAGQRQSLGLPPGRVATEAITVNRRVLTGLALDDRTLYFTFQHLCEAESATIDYLALVEHYDRWILDDMPQLSKASAAAQQRFLNLIDVLYDRRCTLFIISARTFDQAMDSCEVADLARTRSRISQLRGVHPALHDA